MDMQEKCSNTVSIPQEQGKSSQTNDGGQVHIQSSQVALRQGEIQERRRGFASRKGPVHDELVGGLSDLKAIHWGLLACRKERKIPIRRTQREDALVSVGGHTWTCA